MKGGKRAGAGRPPGTPNKRTTELFAKLSEGEMPLEYLLRRMRDKSLEDNIRTQCAIAAAPYIHPRLAATEVTGKNGGAIEVKHSNRDVARAILGVLEEAQVERTLQ